MAGHGMDGSVSILPITPACTRAVLTTNKTAWIGLRDGIGCRRKAVRDGNAKSVMAQPPLHGARWRVPSFLSADMPAYPRIALVLGAVVWPDGQPSQTMRRRVGHAVDLFKAGRVEAILVCGGTGRHGPSEAAVMADLLRASGLPEAAILTEDRSTTTRQNLSNAQAILADHQAHEVIIVTDPYHGPRARLIAWQIGLQARTDTTDWHDIGPRQWLRHLPREALALLATLLRWR